jgi:hypothetical protein
VDTKNLLLELVSNIGSHALFVNLNHLISVDTNVVHTVESGSIYMDLSHIRSYHYDLQAWEDETRYVPRYGVSDMLLNNHPNRLNKLLAG